MTAASATLTAGPDRRVAVVGDVAGHLDELVGELVRLGADPTSLDLPDDLVVVQVGDLVHRGPDSAGVVALVDRYLREQPDHWVQLVGNHEAQYLRPPAFEWPERLSEPTSSTIADWWGTGTMQVAVAVTAGPERYLVTHAGLTAGFWRTVLDRLVDPDRVAAALNFLAGRHDDVLFAAGQLLGGRRPAALAGPLWAAAATELVPSWLDVRLPFSQVHGHTSLYDWHERRFRAGPAIIARTTVDEPAKHEVTGLSGGRLVGVDPGHGARPRRPWRAYVLGGEGAPD